MGGGKHFTPLNYLRDPMTLKNKIKSVNFHKYHFAHG